MDTTLEKAFRLSERFTPKETVVVAVSGGIDSMVLFDVLRQEDLELVIAHVNHGTRPEAAEEYATIERLAKKHGAVFEGHILKTRVKSHFQAKAHEARRAFFIETAKKHGAKKVVLGHHLDDRIETFFMRLVKGSPLPNLNVFNAYATHGDIVFIRPFADIPKTWIETYARKHDIEFFKDATNVEPFYTRNRFRHDILPLLMKENPKFHDIMLEHFDRFQGIEDLIDERVRHILSSDGDTLPNEILASLPEAVFDALIRRWSKGRLKQRKDLSKHLLKDIRRLVLKGDNVTLPLDDEIAFFIEYGQCILAPLNTPKTRTLVIDAFGTYRYDDKTSFIVDADETAHNPSNQMVLWYNDKVFPLYLRTRRPGDTIRLPYGTKKIQDLLIDKKVPKRLRDTLVLLANDEEVLWIPFLKVKIHQEETSRKIHICEVPHAR